MIKVVVFYYIEVLFLFYIYICEILYNMELYFKYVVFVKNGFEIYGIVNDFR